MKLNLTPQQALYYYFNTRNYFNSHMVHCAHRVGHALCCSYSKTTLPGTSLSAFAFVISS
ncbi:MAG: hypothetical protein Q4A24_00110 [Akkermansia sp.]|nr:hypothetical protein [Akkermansia sp.]